jgi:hypothetical protein
VTYPQKQIDISIPRRLAIMDIETTSLDAMTGRVVCIGLLFDNAVNLAPLVICEQDEKKLLERFWGALTENDVLVGHNILEFDLMFIRQRSWILGVKPALAVNLKKYYTDQVVDLMALWTNWSYKYKGAGLDNIAQALGLGGKTGHGSEIAALWANGEYVKLMDYCMSDVWLTYNVYCKMHFREPLGVPLPVFAPVAKPEQRELVPVLAQQKGPVPELLPQATVPQASTPQNGQNGRKRSAKVTYLDMGTAYVLGGNTFTIKDQLKALGGRRSKTGDDWIWQVPKAQFPDVCALCTTSGIRLVAADGTLSVPRGAA